MAWFLVYCTYKVTKMGTSDRVRGSMYAMYTAHKGSNGSNFLTAGFLVYCTYKVTKMGTLTELEMYSKYTAHIS